MFQHARARARFVARLAVVIASASVLGCGPTTTQPVQVMALVRGSSGKYKPTQVQLQSLSDVVKMDGSIAYLVGGAQIRVSSQDPLLALNGGPKTDDELADIYIKQDGTPPKASFVERQGVLWPADFHTWNMVTTYNNVEQAYLYFQDMGVSSDTLGRMRIFYFPSFVLADLSTAELKDNALFYSPVKSLLILPFDKAQEAPLAMNSTIMTHEYAHTVWNKLVYGGAALPAGLTTWSNTGGATPQANLLKALDEGIADFHAATQSCRTSFGCDTRGGESSFGTASADSRDMSKLDKCMDPTLDNMLNTSTIGDFTGGGYEYKVGTVFAASLYHAGKSQDDWEVLSKSLLDAYPKIGNLIDGNLETPDNFNLPAVANIVLDSVSSSNLKISLCSQFLGRMKISPDLMQGHCPAQSIPTGDCK